MIGFQFMTCFDRVLTGIVILAVFTGAGCAGVETQLTTSADIPAQTETLGRIHPVHALDGDPSDPQGADQIKPGETPSGYSAGPGTAHSAAPSVPAFGVSASKDAESVEKSADPAGDPGPGFPGQPPAIPEPPAYTGEKIKLDFYDTDIKNVFRILRSVSGLNFAVDKDVQGKVTLTLEKPVPWDQVLDLVLKMNGLGKKMEGNVVRIATLPTLRQEAHDLQDAITARKLAMEQEKSLEPRITEYIFINYADAQTDIQPHISALLTPERGSVSVDRRSNMVIVTDTREKLDQIREMIFRLDTVTPQIMIEAKVVEVTREFSRSIGMGWNLTNDPSISSGFINDTNVSVNNPVGDGGMSGDFSFFRLFGSSSMALNAKLLASEVQGDVRIVSSPRILTLDNKTARIKQGEEIAYLERDDAGGSAVNFKDVDLLLEVTPHVTPDERISMRVFLTKNDVAGFTQLGVPYLTTNEAETELLVNNNDTVVIGGIVKTTTSSNKSGLPFLTGIPILGDMLLGSSKKEDKRNELLIFLTPSIVQLAQRRNFDRPAD